MNGGRGDQHDQQGAEANRIEFSNEPWATTLYEPPCCEVLSYARSATGNKGREHGLARVGSVDCCPRHDCSRRRLHQSQDGTGPDRVSDTNATMITWTDGKQAIQITCGMPGGCQQRALAMCKGNYTTLNMDNMPTRGDASVVRGTGTVVVRCAA